MSKCKYKKALEEIKQLIHPLWTDVIYDFREKAINSLIRIENIIQEVENEKQV